MGKGGGCRGGGGSDDDDPGGGCLKGLRGRRWGRHSNASPLDAGLSLQSDGCRFTGPQLARADAVLADIVRDDLPPESMPTFPGVEAVCERLVQRLLCTVGCMDPRFACKYLVCLDRREAGEGDALTVEYLVRMDALSSPALYESDSGPPCRVVEGAAQEAVPQGFARLRMQGPGADQWTEFLSTGGFLRRDKIQERFVDLLATAAAPISSPTVPPGPGASSRAPTPAPRGPRGPHSPRQVDESRQCGAPGKVVDAAILPDLLALPADGQLFLATGAERFPDPRDARIAIVEGSPWVRLRLGLTRDVLVKLVLGVGVDRWPRGSDLPARVPLNHPDCLLYQYAATTGCFLVACGPPASLRCDDRPCTWQIWAPCASATLLRHFGPRSAVSRSLRALGAVRRALALRSVSRHALRDLLLWRLERLEHLERLESSVADWAPCTAALHVIAVLDRLVCILNGVSERSYLFPSLHVLTASGRQGSPTGLPASEDALLGDATALAAFLRRLHADCAAQPPPPRPLRVQYWAGEEEAQRDCWARLEEALLPAWTAVMRDSKPPSATRSRRLGAPGAGEAQFPPRELVYVGALLRGLLLARSRRMEGPSSHSWFPGTMRRHPLGAPAVPGTPRSSSESSPNGAPEAISKVAAADGSTADAEDVACLVAVVLDQAKKYALMRKGLSDGSRGWSPRRRGSSSSASSSGSAPRSKGRRRSDSVFRRRYDDAADLLLAAIRSDPGVVVPADDSALVSCVLRWLLLSADRAGALAAPLRRFLRALSCAAHQAAPLHALWAAARARARDELAAIAVFCRLLDSGRVQPLDGVIEAADKGWEWARWLIRLSGRLPGGVHAVLAPSPGRVLRFSLPADALPARLTSTLAARTPRLHRRSSAPSTASSTPAATMTPSVARIYRAALVAIAGGSDVVLDGGGTGAEDDDEEGWEPLHGRLRQASPLTALLLQRHRLGVHRAIGDLLPALLALKKFSVVQEAAETLPEPYRSEALQGVARIARETMRRSAARSRITPTHTLSRGQRPEDCEQYRPRTELASSPPELSDDPADHLTEADRRLEEELRRLRVADSLLGTCRAARASANPHAVDLSGLFEDSVVSPVFQATPPSSAHDLRHGFLELTHDRQLRLGPPPKHLNNNHHHSKKREAVTKL